MTSCECETVYLVTTEPDRAHFRAHGGFPEVPDYYETLAWPESETEDGFTFKTAPSLQELKAAFLDAPNPNRN